MPLVVKDRVRETSTTTGTGTFTLAGAVTGYQSFSAVGNGNTTYYTIYLQGGNEWEVGIGTYTASGTTLSRDTILASSNGGSAVNFSAGVKDVFVTYPAGRSVYYDTATNVTLNALTLSGGTANGVLYLNASKVATSGSALTFDGANFGVGGAAFNYAANAYNAQVSGTGYGILTLGASDNATDEKYWRFINRSIPAGVLQIQTINDSGSSEQIAYEISRSATGISYHRWYSGSAEAMRLVTGGKLNIGGNFTSTNNTLQVTGNTAIGYTTAAPTTGLIVAGNVGIGTDSPAVRLSFGTQFVGNNGYANAIRVYDNGEVSTSQTSNSYGFGFIDSGALSYTAGTGGSHRFFTNNTERARIDSSGTLILRQSSNAANTSVSFNTTVQNALTLDSSGNLTVSGSGATTLEVKALINTASALKLSTTGGIQAGLFMASPLVDSSLGIQTAGTEKVRIASGGNVGIGETNPATKMVVAGTDPGILGLSYIYSTDSATQNKGGQLTFGGSYTGTTSTYFAAIAGRKESVTSGNYDGYLQFLTRNAVSDMREVMRLDSSGNLGLGVTPSANAGQRGLFVSGFDGAYSAVSIGASGGGYGCVGYNLGFTSTVGTIKALASDGMSWIRFQNGAFQFFQQSSATAGTNYTGTQAMTLDASGNLIVGATNTGVGKLVSYYTSTAADPLSPANAGLNVWGSVSVRLLFGTDLSSPYAAYIQASNTGTGFPIALNPSGGDVGIGTMSPGAKLDVSGANAGTVLASRILNTSTSASSDAQQFIYVNGATAGDAYTTWTVGGVTSWSGGIRNSDSDSWYLSPGSNLGTSPAVVVTTSGNLGLGVTPGDWNANNKVFQLANNASLLSRSGFTGVAQNFRYDSADTGIFMSAGYATLYYQNAGKHIWAVSTTSWSGSGSNIAALSDAMTLDASGNLGVGTTSPSSFDASADNLVVGTTSGNNGITIAAGTTGASTINFADGTAGGAQYAGYIDYQHNGDYMRFGTNGGTERARITSGGQFAMTNDGTNAAPAISFTNDLDTGIFRPTTNQLGFATAGVQAMTLDASGRLLINATTSRGDNSPLQVTNDSANSIEVFRGETSQFGPTVLFNKSRGSTGSPTVVGSGDAVGLIAFRGYDGSSYKDAALIQGVVDGTPGANDMPGRIVFSTTADGASSTTERARITSGGDFRVKGAGTAGSTDAFQISGSAPADAARLTSGGDFLVGPTSTYSSAKMTVESTANIGIVSKQGTAGGYCFLSYALNNSGTYYHASFEEAGTQRGSITSNGSATAYNTSSDYRLKDNQQPLTGSGAFIDALKPKTWDWKSGGKGVGFIAHEVAEVSPGTVVGGKDAVDADGKPIMQAMEYGSAEFIANIIAELQSLRARVAQLESKGI